jgi:hypothetical protein
MKNVIDQPVGVESGPGRIRKNPTQITQNQHSIVLERLFGIQAPPIRVDRALGNVELRQNLIHLNNRDIVPPNMLGDLGYQPELRPGQQEGHEQAPGPVPLRQGQPEERHLPQAVRLAKQKRVIIQEVVTSGTPEFVIVCY